MGVAWREIMHPSVCVLLKYFGAFFFFPDCVFSFLKTSVAIILGDANFGRPLVGNMQDLCHVVQ